MACAWPNKASTHTLMAFACDGRWDGLCQLRTVLIPAGTACGGQVAGLAGIAGLAGLAGA